MSAGEEYDGPEDWWEKLDKKSLAEYQKRNRIRLKIEVLTAYGGLRCACCGETILEFLTLDHINNDGARHRKNVNGDMYKWLKEHGYPPGFQVLCRNCNFGKWVNGGVCPHRGRTDVCNRVADHTSEDDNTYGQEQLRIEREGKRFRARHGGRCHECDKRIEVGDDIYWSKEGNTSVALHWDCYVRRRESGAGPIVVYWNCYLRQREILVKFKEWVSTAVLVPMTVRQIYNLVLQQQVLPDKWTQWKCNDWCGRAVETGHLRIVSAANGRIAALYQGVCPHKTQSVLVQDEEL